LTRQSPNPPMLGLFCKKKEGAPLLTHPQLFIEIKRSVMLVLFEET